MSQVSIITASYNYENYIRETIDSVINQTFTDWELIVVDDGSKDNSVNVIKEYCEKDNRIKLYQHEDGSNKGLVETIKLGLSKAQTEWIIFLESDDTIEPNYIEEKLKISKQYPQVDFIFNDVNMFGDEKIINEYIPYFEKQKRMLKEIIFPSNLLESYKKIHTNFIPTFSCIMLKKTLLENVDFSSPIRKLLDMYICLQLAEEGCFYYIDKKLTNWRMHRNSYVNTEYEKNSVADFRFYYKRIHFLYGKFAIWKKICYILKFLRRRLIIIHFNKNDKRIVILGYKIYSK